MHILNSSVEEVDRTTEFQLRTHQLFSRKWAHYNQRFEPCSAVLGSERERIELRIEKITSAEEIYREVLANKELSLEAISCEAQKIEQMKRSLLWMQGSPEAEELLRHLTTHGQRTEAIRERLIDQSATCQRQLNNLDIELRLLRPLQPRKRERSAQAQLNVSPKKSRREGMRTS